MNRSDGAFIFFFRDDYLYVILHMNDVNGFQDFTDLIDCAFLQAEGANH